MTIDSVLALSLQLFLAASGGENYISICGIFLFLIQSQFDSDNWIVVVYIKVNIGICFFPVWPNVYNFQRCFS